MRAILLACVLWAASPLLALAASPTVSHSGPLSATGGTTTVASVTATAGDVVIVCIVVRSTTSSAPGLSIAGASLSWSTRKTITNLPLAGNGIGIGNTLSCFAALTAGALSSASITVTSTLTQQGSSGAWMTVSGTSAAQFDTNALATASTAYANASTPSVPTIPITTSLPHDLLYAAVTTTDQINCGTGTTWGGSAQDSGLKVANSGALKNSCIDLTWKGVSATQAAASVVATGTGNSQTDWSMIVDALTSDTPATPGSRFSPGFP